MTSHIIKYLPKNERVGSPPGASLGFKLEWLHVLGRIVRERDARVMRFLVAAGDYPVGFFGPSESLTEARDLRLRNLEMKEGNFSGVEEESRSHEYGAAARLQPLLGFSCRSVLLRTRHVSFQLLFCSIKWANA